MTTDDSRADVLARIDAGLGYTESEAAFLAGLAPRGAGRAITDTDLATRTAPPADV